MDDRAMFVRFVVGADDEDQRDLTGVFAEAGELRRDGALEDYEAAWLDEVFAWFNEHVPVPPYGEGEWASDAVAWFKATAKEPLKRIWDVVAMLREHDVPVRMLRSADPGFVYYEDDVQVVADSQLPSDWAKFTRDLFRAVVKRELPHGCFKVQLDDGSELIANKPLWSRHQLRVGDVVVISRYLHESSAGRCFIIRVLKSSADA